MDYIQNTDDDIHEMLQALGIESIDELFRDLPEAIKLKGRLSLPGGLSEHEIYEVLRKLSYKNLELDQFISFLGGGCYNHLIPEALRELVSRCEFYTAYTPYQPEASQGNLQASFEYQTMICELTGMDVSNASCYDAATGIFEAVYIALAERKGAVVVSKTLHPEYRYVLRTYLKNLQVKFIEPPFGDSGTTDIEALKRIGEGISCVVVQNPNFFGYLEDMEEISRFAKARDALFIACVNPISLGVLKPPGEYGADIAVGEGQPLGIDPYFGGPGFGFIAARKEFLRRMPGRIVGQTTDLDGKIGYVLALQTREQHIRRSRATSNICTNHALMALQGAIYLALLGKSGLREVGEQMVYKSHYLAEGLRDVKGVRFPFDGSFFGEFVVSFSRDVDDILEGLLKVGIFGGISLKRFYPELGESLLISVTERITKPQMELFLERISRILEC
jgi:glycine dehydrogenase subunit 1